MLQTLPVSEIQKGFPNHTVCDIFSTPISLTLICTVPIFKRDCRTRFCGAVFTCMDRLAEKGIPVSFTDMYNDKTSTDQTTTGQNDY